MREVKHFCDVCGIEIQDGKVGDIEITYRGYRVNTYAIQKLEICDACVDILLIPAPIEFYFIRPSKLWEWLKDNIRKFTRD